MSEDAILIRLSTVKKKLIKEFIAGYMGKELTRNDLKKFTIVHGLKEAKIFFKGSLICHLRFHVKDDTIFAEYLT